MTVAGIVLAAGAGHRLGMPKALLAFRGSLLVERAVALAVTSGCDPVLVVLGASAPHVRETADLGDAVIVVAPNWSAGMGESLRAGLSATAETAAAAAIVLLVDQPMIGAESLRRLIAVWEAGVPAAVATYEGLPGHPVIFGRAVWADVAASAHGDVGARVWLRVNETVVSKVPCDDTGDVRDIDTQEDLFALWPLSDDERAT